MSSKDNSATLQGTRVLIVEDEAMIRMLLEDMLTELGCVIAAEAANITLYFTGTRHFFH